MRWRTPISGVILVVGLAAYTFAATTLGSALPDNILLLTLYYLVAGLIWIWPAVWIMGWARKDDLNDPGVDPRLDR